MVEAPIVEVEAEAGVVWLRLNRPEALNALNRRLTRRRPAPPRPPDPRERGAPDGAGQPSRGPADARGQRRDPRGGHRALAARRPGHNQGDRRGDPRRRAGTRGRGIRRRAQDERRGAGADPGGRGPEEPPAPYRLRRSMSWSASPRSSSALSGGAGAYAAPKLQRTATGTPRLPASVLIFSRTRAMTVP